MALFDHEKGQTPFTGVCTNLFTHKKWCSHGTRWNRTNFCRRLSVQVWVALFQYARLAGFTHGIYLTFFFVLSKNVSFRSIKKSTIQIRGDGRQLHTSLFLAGSDFHISRQRTHLAKFLGEHIRLTKKPVVDKVKYQKAMFDLPRTALHYNVIG